MPLWTIYHSNTAFTTASERDEFAAAITTSYSNLPPFYVAISFHSLDGTHFYRSGKGIDQLPQPFVRLVIHHLARHAADHPEGKEAGFEGVRNLLDGAIKEHVVEKGYLWEYTVLEEDRGMWKIDGFQPPPLGGPAFEEWKANDRAGPY